MPASRAGRAGLPAILDCSDRAQGESTTSTGTTSVGIEGAVGPPPFAFDYSLDFESVWSL